MHYAMHTAEKRLHAVDVEVNLKTQAIKLHVLRVKAMRGAKKG